MTATQLPVSANPRAASIQTYAKIAGVVFLISFVSGGFGEAYVPSQIVVAGNATATAHNIIVANSLFRLGFVGYLIESFTDLALAFLLYVLLRPVHARLAFLTVFFRIMATATFFVAEVFFFAPSFILGGDGYLKTFSPEQLNSLALLSLNVYAFTGGVSAAYYGIASIMLGYLMLRSGYLPGVLGALWILAGLCFVISAILLILAPAAASPLLMVPQLLAALSLGVWLLVRGVNVARGNEREAVPAYASVPS